MMVGAGSNDPAFFLTNGIDPGLCRESRGQWGNA